MLIQRSVKQVLYNLCIYGVDTVYQQAMFGSLVTSCVHVRLNCSHFSNPHINLQKCSVLQHLVLCAEIEAICELNLLNVLAVETFLSG